MGRDQREEFERRVLALIRDQLDYMDEDNAEGYEIGDFVISCRYWGAPSLTIRGARGMVVRIQAGSRIRG